MLRRQSVLQTVLLRGGAALATGALGAQAWAREAPPNAGSGVLEQVSDRPVNASPRLSF